MREADEDITSKIDSLRREDLAAAYQVAEKIECQGRAAEIREQARGRLVSEGGGRDEGEARDTFKSLEGEYRDPLLLHYDFPPFSVGVVSMMLEPKRREIGHGKLAKRGMMAVMPDPEEFPYVIRIVSEIAESNGRARWPDLR